MTRQEWLAKFLSLVDSGAPAINYRRYLGIPISHIGKHVASIGSYREELAKLNEAAKKESLRKLPRVRREDEQGK